MLKKKDIVSEIHQIAKNDVSTNKKLLVNIDNRLGCMRYVEDCEIITKNIDKNSQVLDLGCGVGHISYILAKQGYEITASEIYDEPLYVTEYNKRNSSKISYIKANILEENHALTGKKYDAILLSGVLEHVPDMQLFLQKTFDLLLPGGKLFIQQFPNKYSLFEKINDFRGRSSHDVRLSKYELSLLVTFSTFKVYSASYHQFLPYALNGFPKIIRSVYYKIVPIVRLTDKFLYKFPLTRIGSTSIQIVCSKSTSCKS